MDGSVPKPELAAQFPPPASFCFSVFSHPLCDHLRLCLLSSLLGAVCHDWIGDAPILLCFIFFSPVPPLLQLGLWPLETVTELPVSDNPRGTNFLAASPSAALPTQLVLVAHTHPSMRLESSRFCWLRGPIQLQAVVLPLAETECPRANAGCPGPQVSLQGKPVLTWPRSPAAPHRPSHQRGRAQEALPGLQMQGEAREGARRGR